MFTVSEDLGVKDFIVLLNKPLINKPKSFSHLPHLLTLLVFLKMYVERILMNLGILTYRMAHILVLVKQTITGSIVIVGFSSTYLDHVVATPILSFKI